MASPQKQKAKKNEAAIVHHQEQVVHYQGPVPPPAIMEKLEGILPGAADRIFSMAEAEQKAAHEHQRNQDAGTIHIIQNEHRQNILALVCAFIVCIVFAVCGTILVLNGFVKTGGGLLGLTMLGVTGSFLARWKHRPLTK